jgi:hypothetical protein
MRHLINAGRACRSDDIIFEAAHGISTGTLFSAFGFARAGCRAAFHNLCHATVANAMAVRNAGWKRGDGSDIRLIAATSKPSRGRGSDEAPAIPLAYEPPRTIAITFGTTRRSSVSRLSVRALSAGIFKDGDIS